MTISSAALRFAAFFAPAIAIIVGADYTRVSLANSRFHTATFPASRGEEHFAKAQRTTLKGRVLGAGALFADIVDMAGSGDWLLFLRRDNHLTGLNVRNGSIQDFSAVLPSARADDQSFDSLWIGQKEDELYFGSAFSTRLIRVRVTGAGVEGSGVTVFSRPAGLSYSLPLADDQWLSNGIFQDETTMVVQKLKGERLEEQHRMHGPVFPDLSPFVSFEANRSRIAAQPDGTRVAQVFWFAPVVRIYDTTGTLLHSISPQADITQRFGEQFVHRGTSMRYLPGANGTIRCYVDVTASNRFFVGLFSGKPVPPNIAHRADQLHIFSWEGQVAETLSIDNEVSGIALSPGGEVLWAFRRNPNPVILEYRLPGSMAGMKRQPE